jgi:ribosomal-protein-alanine N-acetyltransferase
MYDKNEPAIITSRLLLRRWRLNDLEAFAEINADPRVMAYYPRPLARSESDGLVEKLEAFFDKAGFGMWAVEHRESGQLIGLTGLNVPDFAPPLKLCVEIGWRYAFSAWGHGYAAEAAKASLEFGFLNLKLPEIAAFTVPDNLRSRAVMERLGMERDPAADFNHPSIPEGHPMSSHVLYRIRRGTFIHNNNGGTR